MASTRKAIGDLLVDNGQITPEELEQAEEERAKTGEPIGSVLSKLGFVTESSLKNALELQYGVNYVNLAKREPEYELIALLPESLIRSQLAVPVSQEGERITVAMVDPSDVAALDEVKKKLTARQLKTVVCLEEEFFRFVDKAFGVSEKSGNGVALKETGNGSAAKSDQVHGPTDQTLDELAPKDQTLDAHVPDGSAPDGTAPSGPGPVAHQPDGTTPPDPGSIAHTPDGKSPDDRGAISHAPDGTAPDDLGPTAHGPGDKAPSDLALNEQALNDQALDDNKARDGQSMNDQSMHDASDSELLPDEDSTELESKPAESKPLYDEPEIYSTQEMRARPGTLVDPKELENRQKDLAPDSFNEVDLAKRAQEEAIVLLANQILGSAIKRHCSNIHIQMGARESIVHYRLSGRLLVDRKLPNTVVEALVARYKMMARLNLAERKEPQDGHIKVKSASKEIVCLISVIPTDHGESIVIWIV